ncbi:MAG: hypothetical protein HRU29_01625 [Rhizobiales bacterium]|nr:hypothetical protein [Hyphomicrobiales bacterium]NRB13074.1 hypothetical protein [Hyphomicrobiales bacterium]
MTAINFKTEFAPAVENKTKWQTIRKPRKVPFKVGEKLQLYTGLRTKECRKLHDAICLSVEPIKITSDVLGAPEIFINGGEELGIIEAIKFIMADGFLLPNNHWSDGRKRPDLAKFTDFFKTNDGSPFEGHLIKWGVAFDKLMIGGYYQDDAGNRVEILEVQPKTQLLWAICTDKEDMNDTPKYSWDGKVLDAYKPKFGNLKWQVEP